VNPRALVNHRVAKLGGSLLVWKSWPRALITWLRHEPPAVTVLLVGGGAAVDDIRRRQRIEQLTDAQAHWLAVAEMTANARRVAQEMQDAELVRSLEPCQKTETIYVLDPDVQLRQAAAQLPQHWGFTSDSIAAWVAGQWGTADRGELVLFKSCPQRGGNFEDWSRRGLVDECFGHFARGLRVRWVNLRAGWSSPNAN